MSRSWVVTTFVLLIAHSVHAGGVKLDPTFGSGGVAMTAVTSAADGTTSIIQDLAGRLVVGGSSPFPGTSGFDFTLARYDASGNLDTSFDYDGIVITPFTNDSALMGLVLHNGRILAVGWTIENRYHYTYSLALARYLDNGQLDPSFNQDGKLTLGTRYRTTSVTLQSDNKIVAAGCGCDAVGSTFLVVRFMENGDLDPSFGTGGFAIVGFGQYAQAYAVAIQKTGKIVVAGGADQFGFSMARLNSDGTLDGTFGSSGTVTLSYGWCTSLLLEPDDAIIALEDSGTRIGILRFKPDGVLDAGFGSGGIVTTSGASNGRGLALGPDGMITASGRTISGSNANCALFRVTSSGIPDDQFGVGGVFVTSISSKDDWASAVLVQSDTKLVATGRAYSQVTNYDFATFRLIEYFRNYGTGCSPTGTPPLLSGAGDATPGGTVTFTAENGLPDQHGFLLVASIANPVGPCLLLAPPFSGVFPLNLDGVATGHMTATVPNVPTGVHGYLQWIGLDGPSLWYSNGLDVFVQ